MYMECTIEQMPVCSTNIQCVHKQTMGYNHWGRSMCEVVGVSSLVVCGIHLRLAQLILRLRVKLLGRIVQAPYCGGGQVADWLPSSADCWFGFAVEMAGFVE